MLLPIFTRTGMDATRFSPSFIFLELGKGHFVILGQAMVMPNDYNKVFVLVGIFSRKWASLMAPYGITSCKRKWNMISLDLVIG